MLLQTGPQARLAIKKIIKKTKWSIRKIGLKSDIDQVTIKLILTGKTKNPTDGTLAKLSKLYEEVEKL